MVIEEVDLCVSRWCIVGYIDQMYDCGSDDYTTHGAAAGACKIARRGESGLFTKQIFYTPSNLAGVNVCVNPAPYINSLSLSKKIIRHESRIKSTVITKELLIIFLTSPRCMKHFRLKDAAHNFLVNLTDDEIRQDEGFKNVNLGNVVASTEKSKKKANFVDQEDHELLEKWRAKSFDVQVSIL